MSSHFDKLLSGIYQAEQEIIQNKPKPKLRKQTSVSDSQLQLALTVMLVDLASIDQNFDVSEYNTISQGLHRVFGTTKQEVQSLVNQANLVLANLRGTSRFAELLKKEMDIGQRKAIMEIIDEVIGADGKEGRL